ncbi:nitroreductase family protein [Candidatus Pacearchaeota archaeon]|nr:nitroreductase family protein [Candidatus Pacearchaeota archaeon]
MEFDEVVARRQSIRHYSSKPVDFSLITEITEAAIHAPTAGNISTTKLVIVSDKELRDKLAAAAGQEFIAAAPWIIIVCSKNDLVVKNYEERGLMYSRQQAGASIQNMLLKITDLGLASCWIGAFDDNAVKRILHVPDDIEVEAILPVAYSSKFHPQMKRRKPDLKLILFFEQYGQTVQRKPRQPEAK